MRCLARVTPLGSVGMVLTGKVVVLSRQKGSEHPAAFGTKHLRSATMIKLASRDTVGAAQAAMLGVFGYGFWLQEGRVTI